jgi:hypothetical protein
VTTLDRRLANLAFANFTAGTGILGVAGAKPDRAAGYSASIASKSAP